MKDINTVGWESLNVFVLNCYPNHLIVTTDATWEVFQDACRIFGEETQDRNIEGILNRMGYCAVAADAPETLPAVTL